MTKEEAIKSFEEENRTMLENKTAYINELKARGMEFEDRMVSYIDESVERNELAISALKDGWIPADKREPEDIGNYIVTLDYDVHGRVVSQCFYHGKTIRWADFNDSVTAWREDIEPYKKGGE